jgi:hypothetical protein
LVSVEDLRPPFAQRAFECREAGRGVDALALMEGERVSEFVNRPTPRLSTRSVSREDAENRSFADLVPELRAIALGRYTPHPIAALEAPVALKSFRSLPWRATVIRCRRAANPPETHQRRTAQRLGGQYHEIHASHYPMLSHPDVAAPLVMQG